MKLLRIIFFNVIILQEKWKLLLFNSFPRFMRAYKWQVELIRVRDENNDKSETEPRQLF